jgi:hypothetical protein
MIIVVPTAVFFRDAAGEIDREVEIEFLDEPAKLLNAFRRRLLLDFFCLDFSRPSGDPFPMLSPLLLPLPSSSASTPCWEIGDSVVGDEGVFKYDWWPSASSMRKKAVTAVHPE